MVDNIRGMHTTGNILADRLQFDWSGIYLRQPNQFPLVVLLAKLAMEQALQPKFNHFEEEDVTDTVTVDGAMNDSVTTMVLDDNTSIVVGEVLHNPLTGENFYVSAVDSGGTDLTVTRGYGGTTAAAVADDQDIRNIGPTAEEGGELASAVSSKVEIKYNYTQIYKKTIDLSKTLEASQLYGGKEEARLIAAKEREWKRAVNYSFQFGSRSLGTLNGRPIRQTGGLLEWITTNVTDNSGASLTEAQFEAFLASVFQYGNTDRRVLIASPLLSRVITGFAKDKLQVFQGPETYGIRISRYESVEGTVDIVRDRLLKGATYGAWGWMLDLNNIKMKSLRSVKMRRNVQNPGDDAIKHEIIGEMGVKIIDERTHGIIKNFTA